jgi:hypothetical protein
MHLHSCNVLIVSLVNPLQCVSLLQPMDALVLLHLPHADLILQIGQLLLQLVEMVLVPPIPTYLHLHGLVLEGANAQVYLIPIRVTSAEEPYVSDSIVGALIP